MKEFEQLMKFSRKLEVKPINEDTGSMGDSWEVGDKMVRIFNKKGRKLITCTCNNDDRFVNQPNICIHKVRLINFLCYDRFERELNKMLEEYTALASNGIMINSKATAWELQSLKDKILR